MLFYLRGHGFDVKLLFMSSFHSTQLHTAFYVQGRIFFQLRLNVCHYKMTRDLWQRKGEKKQCC